MPADLTRIYFDANVFLAFVGDESGRAGTVESLLGEASRRELEVVTSVLSIAEVAFGALERDQGLTEEGEQRIDQLWVPASPVTLVDVSQVVARRARSIMREAQRQAVQGIKGADAIHLATADMVGCTQVFTYERDSSRSAWEAVTGISVSEPFTNSPQLDL